ncbi:microtubule-associated protein 70-2-like isoform X3 [Durio zibethinus]|uniref:Microtubule-associated protein 70-2-like isoform X3 n=1 Tax=Durio zibethinus TaxID=66656 RepID=A0A6P5Z4Y4_DURZI|nr:microtubule-associated protein 70-2-like isoform X3 [Durio zibethinus]
MGSNGNGNGNGNGNYYLMSNGDVDRESLKPAVLSSSAALKARKAKPNVALPRHNVDDIITLLHGSDPVRVELNRLENEVRDKDRELADANAEIKSLRNSERLKERAVEELTDELKKVDEKLKVTEALLESKNLEIKKISDEKKAALAAQFAAEATLRRVHAAQKDDEMPPIEAIITPLEAELKLARLEAVKLQEDNRALDRLTKSKEAALLEAERTVQIALAKASLVDDLQNKNQELMKQIEICQEENKILDKMHRQKVAEVEKLTQTVRELEEAVLAGGAAANAVREFHRKVQEMNGEMQQLRDKLAIAERAAKAEAQLKEKYQLRFKVLEERLKSSSCNSRTGSEGRSMSNGPSRRQSLGGAENLSKSSSNVYLSRRTLNPHSGSVRSNTAGALLNNVKMSSKSFDGSRSVDRDKLIPNVAEKNGMLPGTGDQILGNTTRCEGSANGITDKSKAENKDFVSGMLYDTLQKEVIALRKACHEKDQSLKDKDDAIEMLAKKVETLNKAMEVEAKKMRREVAAMEKEVAAMRVGKEHDQRTRRTRRGAINGSELLSARNGRR